MRDAAGRIVCWFGSATNVQQQHHAREALEQQVRERTGELEQVVARERAILGSAASAIIATDLSGRIVTFNPGAEALFRMSEHQALHRPVLELYDLGEVRSAAESLPAQVLETMLPEAQPPEGAAEGALRSEWGFVRADGTRFPGLLNVSLLRDGRSCVIGFLCVIADLTERRAMEEVLRQRTAQAESANRAKSAFLATMSHEFRTPLNAVIGLSQLLEQMALPERALTFVRHIGQAGEQLLGLTNDVLDLSRIEAGEMQLEQVHFPLVPLLEAVQALVHPQAVAKGLTLHVEFSPALPAQLCGDPLRLKQILLNLLGNAIKFTRAGRVKLRLQQIGRRPGQVTLRIEVTDTGIGIPAEAQARIFEPFTQADSSTTRRFGGSGLGLSIVRRLVGMMGGQMELESAPQRGSTFRITLPLATAAAGAEARPPGAAAADPAPAA
jgi:PAS domain S-box-containing protein